MGRLALSLCVWMRFIWVLKPRWCMHLFTYKVQKWDPHTGHRRCLLWKLTTCDWLTRNKSKAKVKTAPVPSMYKHSGRGLTWSCSSSAWYPLSFWSLQSWWKSSRLRSRRTTSAEIHKEKEVHNWGWVTDQNIDVLLVVTTSVQRHNNTGTWTKRKKQEREGNI